jgi:membrane associated rhomboid family serine protease
VTFFLFILLGIAGVVAYRVSTPEERKRFYAFAYARGLTFLADLKTAANRPRPDYDAFRDELRARMRFAVVTPAIALISAAIFVLMLFGDGAMSNPETLMTWGASLGIRTTNGEWWRLVTSTFVHTGMLHVLVDLAILIQLGLILERLVGRLTIAAVYLSAGIFDGLINVSSHPVAVTVSASGAIFGLYGLMIVALIWQTFHGWRRRPSAGAQELTTYADAQEADAQAYSYEYAQQASAQEVAANHLRIPPIAMRRLAIGGVFFILYSAFSGHATTAEFIGLLVGMMYGVIFARHASECVPRTRAVAYAMGATAAVAAIAAFAIGSIANVKPELARVLDLEKSTAAEYQAELDGLKKGRVTAEALARLAEGHIVSEFQEADARLQALSNVPPEHRTALADAREYVRLRSASWAARGTTIRRSYAKQPQKPDGADDTAWRIQLQEKFRSDSAARARAEGAERDSLQALQRVARFLTEHA